ncbi:MAG: metal ABC transporter ATP-binding protein [Schwartzia sp.]|nr:metal ABC transporter ATP-binding protein [Schwartzia sp. (in: firmicutes)]
MPQIVCENLSLGYEGETIVQDLSFSVEEGMYLCIVGENGAGKSTLMKTLLGLHAPLSGRVVFGDGLRQREIGYLSQQTDVQRDFPASVREIVLSGCQGRMGWRPFYRREEKELAERNMERMGVIDLAGRCYRELSGGQQQRVLLARALCATQKLLLMDEPVSGLDPVVTADMYRVIEELHRSGVTILMITHDVTEALPYATHILHLGRRRFFGTRDEYLRDRRDAFAVGGEGEAQ